MGRNNVGIVAASGTGAQETSSLICGWGGGISQVIGVGSRDLGEEVGGIMMIEGIKALIEDEDTEVILLVSKPPSKKVATKILKICNKKPTVVHFAGDTTTFTEIPDRVTMANSLEDAAYKAFLLSQGKRVKSAPEFSFKEKKIGEIVEKEVALMRPEQRYLRMIYTGGTLCYEAMHIFGEEIYSNTPLKSDYLLKDPFKSYKNCAIDFGDDIFTAGRAHPMIDPSLRTERLIKESEDNEVAVVLLDFILGYGSNMDPVGETIPAIKVLKSKNISVVTSICGTNEDPQDMQKQKKMLEEQKVVVMESNAQATRMAKLIWRQKNEEHKQNK